MSRVAAAFRGVTVGHMPTGRGISPLADIPDGERRDGGFTNRPSPGERFLDNSACYADSYNMTLELKIRRVGNSLGIIIPTEALALLNVREGDALFLTEAAEGSVRLSAQRPGFAEKAAIADDLIQRYRNAFNELAK